MFQLVKIIIIIMQRYCSIFNVICLAVAGSYQINYHSITAWNATLKWKTIRGPAILLIKLTQWSAHGITVSEVIYLAELSSPSTSGRARHTLMTSSSGGHLLTSHSDCAPVSGFYTKAISRRLVASYRGIQQPIPSLCRAECSDEGV